MKYQNRAPRCRHGFMREVVPCPVCDGRPEYRHCEPSVVKHTVINRRGHGRERAQRAAGYTYGRDVGGGRAR